MKKEDFDYLWTDKKRTIFGLPISFTRYFLTKEKLITRKGFLSISEDECELYRVTDKRLKLPFMQRLFGCGTVYVHVKNDADSPIKEIKSIKLPRKFMKLLEENVNIQRDKYSIRGRDMVGAGHDGCMEDDVDDI
ncbi:MAG: PH domain-containing protein [Oscillospiraceae bacterium]|nr:PH domain-containing protein [Oscillospiraceae bacterium]